MTVGQPGLAVFSIEAEHDGRGKADRCEEMSRNLAPMQSLDEGSSMQKPMPDPNTEIMSERVRPGVSPVPSIIQYNQLAALTTKRCRHGKSRWTQAS